MFKLLLIIHIILSTNIFCNESEIDPYYPFKTIRSLQKQKVIQRLQEVQYEVDDRVIFSTYYGGDSTEAMDCAYDVKINSQSEIIMVGFTGSPDLPMRGNSYQDHKKNGYDMIITKWAENGQPIWTTYFGGNSDDVPYASALDKDDNIYVVGRTTSADYPVTEGIEIEDNKRGSIDVAVAKFDTKGNLVWSTVIGGSGQDIGYGIDVDQDGNVYICGSSLSKNYPTIVENPYLVRHPFDDDFVSGIVTKLNSDGSMNWSRYYGGLDVEELNSASVYGNELACVGYYRVEYHLFNKLVLTDDAWQFENSREDHDKNNFLITKFDTETGELTFATLYGGVGKWDKAISCDHDSKGNLFVIGETNSNNILKTGKGFTTDFTDQMGVLLQTNLNNELVYDTYLGTWDVDKYFDLSIDHKDIIWIASASHGHEHWVMPKDTFALKDGGYGTFFWRIDPNDWSVWYSYFDKYYTAFGIDSRDSKFAIVGIGIPGARQIIKDSFQDYEYRQNGFRDECIYFSYADLSETFPVTSIETKDGNTSLVLELKNKYDSIEIFDFSGKLINKLNCNGQEIINVNQLKLSKNTMYFIKLNGKNSKVLKVIY